MPASRHGNGRAIGSSHLDRNDPQMGLPIVKFRDMFAGYRFRSSWKDAYREFGKYMTWQKKQQ